MFCTGCNAFYGVTGVTRVQASVYAGLAVTPAEKRRCNGVTPSPMQTLWEIPYRHDAGIGAGAVTNSLLSALDSPDWGYLQTRDVMAFHCTTNPNKA